MKNIENMAVGQTAVVTAGPTWRELMEGVSKEQAKQFILTLKRLTDPASAGYVMGKDFTLAVIKAYSQATGKIASGLNANTANALVGKMEKKGKIEY